MTLPVLGADDAGDLRDLGGKAAPLSRLRRSGFPVPAGFVVPVPVFARHARASGARAAGNIEEAQERLLTHGADEELRTALAAALDALPGGRDTPVAVRSSATAEDAPGTAAAGVHDSFLGSRGPSAVTEAVLRCWTSWWSPRDLRPAPGTGQDGADGMAVLVQVLVDADAAGVLFTGERRVLEAVHGLGERLVGGAVTPDSWELGDAGIRAHRSGSQELRTVRRGDRVLREPLPAALRGHPPLSEERVREIDELGRRIAVQLGGPVDLEWAFDGAGVHVLQARPLTAALPAPSAGEAPAEGAPVDGAGAAPPGTVLRGVGASGGTATGTVRVLRSVTELSRVRPGDVLLARATDPAWTPLFPLISAVVTETGGMLSHAAIVAREVGIPAVLAVPDAMERLEEGTAVRVDGERGTLTVLAAGEG
jgi:pyruvate,water dikinase